ncbi:MAG: hypothetical protein JXR95_01965 [Deltaproteobacteria bacterium]|nr:hypothetical protein [Deltaproteobacteria bacterium]
MIFKNSTKDPLLCRLKIFLLVALVFFVVSCDDTTTSSNNNQNNSTINNSSNNLNDAGTDLVNDAVDDGSTDSSDVTDTVETDTTDAAVENPVASLRVYPLDIWGRYLPEDKTSLNVEGDSNEISISKTSYYTVLLGGSGDFSVCLSSDDFHEICLDFNVDNAGVITGFDSENYEFHGVISGDSSSGEVPETILILGLPHRWFSSSGRAPRYNNYLTLLMDGEEAWSDVRESLESATQKILFTSWWWDSEFELTRDGINHIYLSDEERWDNTILGILENTSVTKRVMVGEFWGTHEIFDWITMDDELLSYAEAGEDNFEFMGQGNPVSDQFWFEIEPFDFISRVRNNMAGLNSVLTGTQEIYSEVPGKYVDFSDYPVGISFQIASWHQKFSVIDDALTYVGGMNVKGNDWDTSNHAVFDYYRMYFDSTESERLNVFRRESETDFPPRKDYILRIDGTAAVDTSDVFKKRWDYGLSEGFEFSENASSFTISEPGGADFGESTVQITTTMPPPFSENSILETWHNAISEAENYIFIEDQYFRIPYLLDLLIDRMNTIASLKLVVITMPINEWTDGGCYWTYETVRILKNAFPDRFFLYQLRSFDYVETWGWDETESRFADMYIHSKMLIVDDKFMSVGSCNKNNRGVIYEGEMNAAVLDPQWVKSQRQRIITNLTGDDSNEMNWIQSLENNAAMNDAVYRNWDDEGGDISLDGAPLPLMYTPEGFVYSLSFPDPSECLVEDIGPDLF